MKRIWTAWGFAVVFGACGGSDDTQQALVDAGSEDSSAADGSVDYDAAPSDGSSGSSADTSGENADGSSDAQVEPDTSGAPDLGADTSEVTDVTSDADTVAEPDAVLDADAADGSGGSDATTDGSGTTVPDALVAEIDFEAELPSFIEVSTCALTPSQGFEPLGPEGNRFGPTFIRCQTGQAVAVTLTDLPPHTAVSIDFLFAAIDSLDGEGTFPSGDFFRIDVDSVPIFREAFSNALESQIQTYVPPVPEIVLARRVELGFNSGGFFTDSAYDMSLDPVFDRIPHTASTLTIAFLLEGEGVQSIDDESWAIDNLRVTTHND